MGYAASMRAFVGYTLTRNQVFTSIGGPTCAHKPAKGARFCSECGAEVGVVTKAICRLVEGDHGLFEFLTYGCSEGPTLYAAGIVTAWQRIEDGYEVRLPLTELPADLPAYARELQERLAQEGIHVDLADFGVFALSHESC